MQIIRAAAILQLLLGNIGRPGGGILALRGHASIQGSTDIPTLYDILPGYLPMPFFEEDANVSGQLHSEAHHSSGSVVALRPDILSACCAPGMEKLRPQDNEWGFHWLPRVTGDHSELGYWLDMADGKLEGLFVMGQNPAVGAPNGRLQRTAMKNLKWLVVRDLVETETASFWNDSPEVERGELNPEEIGTEVFLLPAAGQAEKSGTFTNTQRLLQWHNKAVDPPGDARSETWFIYHLGRLLKEKAAKDPADKNAALNALTWDFRRRAKRQSPMPKRTCRRSMATPWTDKKLLAAFEDLKADGSTAADVGSTPACMPKRTRTARTQRESKDASDTDGDSAWPKDISHSL